MSIRLILFFPLVSTYCQVMQLKRNEMYKISSVSHSLKKGQGAGQKKGTFDAEGHFCLNRLFKCEIDKGFYVC